MLEGRLQEKARSCNDTPSTTEGSIYRETENRWLRIADSALPTHVGNQHDPGPD